VDSEHPLKVMLAWAINGLVYEKERTVHCHGINDLCVIVKMGERARVTDLSTLTVALSRELSHRTLIMKVAVEEYCDSQNSFLTYSYLFKITSLSKYEVFYDLYARSQ
jgi:hypothetical protein